MAPLTRSHSCEEGVGEVRLEGVMTPVWGFNQWDEMVHVVVISMFEKVQM